MELKTLTKAQKYHIAKDFYNHHVADACLMVLCDGSTLCAAEKKYSISPNTLGSKVRRLNELFKTIEGALNIQPIPSDN